MDVIVLLQMVKVLYCVRSQPPPGIELNSGIYNMGWIWNRNTGEWTGNNDGMKTVKE